MAAQSRRGERSAEIVARVRAGLSHAAVAADMGVHRATVYRALRRTPGAPPSTMGRPRKVVDLEHARRLRACGFTMVEIALRVGLNRDALAQRLRAAGGAGAGGVAA